MARIQGSDRIKLIGAVVVLLVAAGLAYYRLRDSGPLPNSIKMVCVATGKIFDVARDKIDGVPMKNPKTGEDTLVPCYQRDGAWYVDPHYKKQLLDLGEKNRHVDTKTLAVQTAS